MYCKFCGKNCKNKNSLTQHEIRCSLNPNKLHIKGNTHSPWNKGLTKDTDERVAKISLKISDGVKRAIDDGHFIGKAKTSEKELLRKRHISETAKRNGLSGGLRKGSGRGKKGWYKDIYCRSTYELVYVIYNIDNDIKFKPCKRVYDYEYEGKKHKYYPDFELEDGTIIEIKGYSNNQTKAKINSVKDRPIKVLYKNDLEYAFKYVQENYMYNKLEDLYE